MSNESEEESEEEETGSEGEEPGRTIASGSESSSRWPGDGPAADDEFGAAASPCRCSASFTRWNSKGVM